MHTFTYTHTWGTASTVNTHFDSDSVCICVSSDTFIPCIMHTTRLTFHMNVNELRLFICICIPVSVLLLLLIILFTWSIICRENFHFYSEAERRNISKIYARVWNTREREWNAPIMTPLDGFSYIRPQPTLTHSFTFEYWRTYENRKWQRSKIHTTSTQQQTHAEEVRNSTISSL